MEYEYYVDQIQKKLESANSSDSVLTPDPPALIKFESALPNLTSSVESSIQPPIPAMPVCLESKPSIEELQVKTEVYKRIAKPRQREADLTWVYVRSLLVSDATAEQYRYAGDVWEYFKFKAASDSIVCELTKARSRLKGTTGPSSFKVTRYSDFEAHRTAFLVWGLGIVLWTIFISLYLSKASH